VKTNIDKLITSPYGATLFPIILMMLSFAFPSSLYEYLINEPNYMFLNYKIITFGMLCILFYYIGVYISNYKPFLHFRLLQKLKHQHLLINFKIILAFVIILQFVYFFFLNIFFYKSLNQNLLEIVFSGRGQLIKDYLGIEIKIPFGIASIPNYVLGIEFWLIYNLYTFQKGMFDIKNLKYLKLANTLSLILLVIFNIISVNRPILIILIIGYFVIHSYFRKESVIFNLAKSWFIILLLFVFISILRWSSNNENLVNLILNRLLGYTIASFNRFAFIIDGKLSYVDVGIPKVFYIFPILKIPLTNIEFHNFLEYSRLSLSACGNLGLNPDYNMATLFGGIYQSIGIATPIYFLFLGFIGRRLYISFKNGKTFGIIFYPLFYAYVVLCMIDVNIFIMFFPYFFYAFLSIVLLKFLFNFLIT